MAPRLEEPSGLLIIDKPVGPTSHDIVDRVRRAGRLAKVGHTGTLDPFATGVLPLCINRATRLASLLTDGDKAYTGVVRLGIRTNTQDSTGEVIETRPVPEDLTLEAIREVALQFVGEIEQRPPMFSAVKIGGKRLYELARAGEDVERPTRSATVHKFHVHQLDACEIVIEVVVSKGTYVRTLAEDLGLALGCGAHVVALRRTAAGPFALSRAVTLEQAVEAAEAGELERLMIPLNDALPHIAALELRVEARNRVVSGNVVRRGDLSSGLEALVQGGLVQLRCDGELLGLGTALVDAEAAAEAPAAAHMAQPKTVVAPEAIARSRAKQVRRAPGREGRHREKSG